MDIDFDKLLKDCLAVAKSNLTNGYEKVKPFAEHSFRQFAEDAAFLAKLRASNEIDDAELKHRLDMQKLAISNVLLSIEGIGLIQAQNTINDIIKIVGNTIFAAFNVVLPI